MTMFMTGANVKGEILTGPERRRRWSPAEKVAIVQETYEPGVTVSLVARRHGLSPAQLFAWRRLASQGALAATGADEPVVPASDYQALQRQIRELQRLLGKNVRRQNFRDVLKRLLTEASAHQVCQFKRLLAGAASVGARWCCA